jgi:hypothetical protein
LNPICCEKPKRIANTDLQQVYKTGSKWTTTKKIKNKKNKKIKNKNTTEKKIPGSGGQGKGPSYMFQRRMKIFKKRRKFHTMNYIPMEKKFIIVFYHQN